MRGKYCYKCKWCKGMNGGGSSIKACMVADSGRPALFRYGNKIYDRRGPREKGCLLYEPGYINGMEQMKEEDYRESVMNALQAYDVEKITRCTECGRLMTYKTKIPNKCEWCKTRRKGETEK